MFSFFFYIITIVAIVASPYLCHYLHKYMEFVDDAENRSDISSMICVCVPFGLLITVGFNNYIDHGCIFLQPSC